MLVKVNLEGEPGRVVKKMIKDGWVTTPQEAIRLALYVLWLESKRNHAFEI
jgi:hypothetical protein